MKRIIATGTFDILHPGHLFFLSESRKLGDELWVIVARNNNIHHKPLPVVPEEQRLKMIQGLKCVDHAILGDKDDMFKPIREIQPDIITLGYNQYFDERDLKKKLLEQGIHADVIRIKAYNESKFSSSSMILNEAIKRWKEDKK